MSTPNAMNPEGFVLGILTNLFAFRVRELLS